MQKRHHNRDTVSDNKSNKRQRKEKNALLENANESFLKTQDYDLGWFHPNEYQKDLIRSIIENDLTVVQGSSGVGKSTTAIWQALHEIKRGEFKSIIFVKTPSQIGDDDLGALKGSTDDKLKPHFDGMRSIFHSFMSKAKLTLEEKHGRIIFDIPNFMAGRTFDNVIIIIDESQMNSPETTKMMLERAGVGTKVVLLGDKAQCYSTKKRVDGLSDFINRTFKEVDGEMISDYDIIGYVRLPAEANMRSELSKTIVKIYEGEE